MRAYSAIAIVLRRIPFGETDKILTLYGRDQGRFSAIAKGARKPVSRLSGATEVLTCARFSLAAGKNLEVVTAAEVRESFPHLRGDLVRLTHGLSLADLVEHSTVDHAPNPLLYDLLTAGLYLVQKLPDPATATRWFEIQLIDDLGYSPD